MKKQNFLLAALVLVLSVVNANAQSLGGGLYGPNLNRYIQCTVAGGCVITGTGGDAALIVHAGTSSGAAEFYSGDDQSGISVYASDEGTAGYFVGSGGPAAYGLAVTSSGIVGDLRSTADSLMPILRLNEYSSGATANTLALEVQDQGSSTVASIDVEGDATFRNVTTTGPILLPDGTLANNALAFSAAVNTGIFREGAANGMTFTRAGAREAHLAGGWRVPSTYAYSWTSAADPSGAIDVSLYRDAANTLALRNSTNAQAFRVYNTYTDASNYERGVFDFTTNANILTIGTALAGTGAIREVRFITGGGSRWGIAGGGAFYPITSNAIDIGGTANFVRALYTGRIVTGAATPTVGTCTNLGTGGACNVVTGSSDLAGRIALVVGTGSPGNTGSATLTFSTASAYGTNGVSCQFTGRNSGGTWNNQANFINNAGNTTAVPITWDNNGVALTVSVTYHIDYQCIAF